MAAAVLGGFALLVDGRWALLHLPVLAWAAFVNLSGRPCPLTPLEKRWRQAAGEIPFAGGFVLHYFGFLLPRPCPERTLELVVGCGLLLWNALVYSGLWWWLGLGR